MDDCFGYPNLYGNRTFQSQDSRISGESVVLENKPFIAGRNPSLSDDLDHWPHQLSDYLRGYLGRLITVKYQISNDRYCEKAGVLRVVGANFIGLQPISSDDLLLLDFSVIKSISIGDYRGYKTGRY